MRRLAQCLRPISSKGKCHEFLTLSPKSDQDSSWLSAPGRNWRAGDRKGAGRCHPHRAPYAPSLVSLDRWANMQSWESSSAAEEVNAAGGVPGRKIELVMEDSINPQTAATKAERLVERDKVVMIIGEISSASGLAIGQVANRMKTVFINTGCNSDALRGASCNPYMFHIEGANSMYVMAVGQYLLRENMVKGKKWFSLTADYAFGHDLLRVAKKFMEGNGGQFVADELVATDANDFSPYLLKIRQAQPDLVISNLAGNQITNFLKQYSEFELKFPVAGFGFDTVVTWGAGKGNFSGIWPLVWHHLVDTPSSKKYVDAFQKKYGKLPDNQSWGDYNSLKIVAQSMNDIKSADPQKLAEHLTQRCEVRCDEGA